jgi:hypothetical protein
MMHEREKSDPCHKRCAIRNRGSRFCHLLPGCRGGELRRRRVPYPAATSLVLADLLKEGSHAIRQFPRSCSTA